MGTVRQKKVAKLIVENATLDIPLNGAQIVEKSGYAEIMKKNPKNVIDTEGVQEELAIIGFDEDSAKKVVSTILHGEETANNDKLKAADMIFKVTGGYAPEKRISANINTTIVSDEKANKLAKKYEEKLKQLNA